MPKPLVPSKLTYYQVIYWSAQIPEHDRNDRNLSDGAIFSYRSTAKRFSDSVTKNGGAVVKIQEWIHESVIFDESVEDAIAV